MNRATAKLSCDSFGLKANRLLLPLDLAKCPLEIFPLANGFTKPFEGEIILLHVLEPGTNAKQGGANDTSSRHAERHLERIRRDFLIPTVEATIRVRIGIPHEEILREATATNADLILLPTFAPSLWEKWAGLDCRATARNLIVDTPCRVFVVDVQNHFNCFRRWAREEASGPWVS
jgi:nucleotide-binding universal stress UspA family protein